jgi:hypothetical protein
VKGSQLVTTRLGSSLFWLSGLVLLTGVGIALSENQRLALAVAVLAVGAGCLALPAGAWGIAALLAALTLVFGYVPSIATPLAWGALVAALVRRPGRPTRSATVVLRWLGLLVFAVAAAWAFDRSEPLRPVVYLALLGQPFAVVAAMLIDPPSARLRTAIVRILVVLVAVQLPLAAWQLHRYGLANPDQVQGTLAFAQANGAHLIAGVLGVACVWLLASKRRRLSWWVLGFAALLLGELIVADAKQVLLTLPVGVLVAAWRSGRLSVVTNGILIAAALALLIVIDPYSQDVVYRLQQARHGRNGKAETANIVWKHLESDPASLAFGKGPAESVSRAAFLTTEAGGDSSFQSLGLQPAKIAAEAQKGAQAVSGGGTSINSGVSSMLGVFGDLGLFGAFAYGGLFLSVLSALWRKRSSEAVAATAGWVMLAALGLIYDWWEQPPFTLFLALLTGLALTLDSPAGEEV